LVFEKCKVTISLSLRNKQDAVYNLISRLKLNKVGHRSPPYNKTLYNRDAA